MKVMNREAAWAEVNKIFPTDYEKNGEASNRAGYPVYRSTADGINAWISDMGDRLEVNLPDGKSVNIWIEESEEKQKNEQPAMPHYGEMLSKQIRDTADTGKLTAFEKYRAVQEQNSDFLGWLSILGTSIDYPVMQTVDEPNFYLKRGFDKQYSDYGVPYVQENCDLALSDNCVIYGHHMNNGTMFADLCKYESEDFYQEHKTIRFDTLSGFGEYEIMAVFKTVAYSEQGFKYYHFTRAESAEDFDAYIAQCKALSLYDTGVTAEYDDKLITLSTCEYSRKNGRMVVVAKRIAAPSAEAGSNEA